MLAPSAASVDFLFLLPTVEGCHWFAFGSNLTTSRLVWHETGIADGGLSESALQQQLATHPLAANTPVALVAPPDIGGVLLLPATNASSRDLGWQESMLQRHVPFGITELFWRARLKSGHVELFWLPKSWVSQQASLMDRLGLRLQEIYPRAALWRQESMVSEVETLCIQESGTEEGGQYFFQKGLMSQFSMRNDADACATSMSVAGQQRSPLKTIDVNLAKCVLNPSMSDRLVRLRDAADEAIHYELGNRALWQPMITLGSFIAILMLLAVASLSYQTSLMEQELLVAKRELKRYTPFLAQYQSANDAIRQDRQYLDALEGLESSLVPYAELSAIAAVLPDKAWLQRVRIEPERITLVGSGANPDQVISDLATKSLSAQVLPDASAASPGFGLSINRIPRAPVNVATNPVVRLP